MKVVDLLFSFQKTQESVQSRIWSPSYEFFFKTAADSKTATAADVAAAELHLLSSFWRVFWTELDGDRNIRFVSHLLGFPKLLQSLHSEFSSSSYKPFSPGCCCCKISAAALAPQKLHFLEI